jgi:hypothetical protein
MRYLVNNKKLNEIYLLTYKPMKNFRTKLSVTKLVLLVMVLILGFQTVYLTLQWVETSLFNNVMLSIVAFYFGQKSMQYKEVDSLVKDLSWEEWKDGQPL